MKFCPNLGRFWTQLHGHFSPSFKRYLKIHFKQEKIISKAGIIVSSNLMTKCIKENNEILEDLTIEDLSNIENQLTVYYDFLLNNFQIGTLNRQSKQYIYDILTGKDVTLTEDISYEEKINIYTAKHILNLKQDEKRLFKDIENKEHSQ